MARHLLQAVADMDVWQETNGETCEYLHREFGLSDPLQCITEAVKTAERNGQVWLPPGRQLWELTHAGREELRWMQRLAGKPAAP